MVRRFMLFVYRPLVEWLVTCSGWWNLQYTVPWSWRWGGKRRKCADGFGGWSRSRCQSNIFFFILCHMVHQYQKEDCFTIDLWLSIHAWLSWFCSHTHSFSVFSLVPWWMYCIVWMDIWIGYHTRRNPQASPHGRPKGPVSQEAKVWNGSSWCHDQDWWGTYPSSALPWRQH